VMGSVVVTLCYRLSTTRRAYYWKKPSLSLKARPAGYFSDANTCSRCSSGFTFSSTA
jgi:hypothetical protein